MEKKIKEILKRIQEDIKAIKVPEDQLGYSTTLGVRENLSGLSVRSYEPNGKHATIIVIAQDAETRDEIMNRVGNLSNILND